MVRGCPVTDSVIGEPVGFSVEEIKSQLVRLLENTVDLLREGKRNTMKVKLSTFLALPLLTFAFA